MQKWKGCSLSCVGMERVGCSTTPKATDTWGSGGKEYSRVLEHSLGVKKHHQGIIGMLADFFEDLNYKILHFSRTGVYVGGWKNGLQDGNGTAMYNNGNKYTGQFK